MKLNYKRTIFVGFAFFLICTFWQAYDNIIPKILTDKFGMSQTVSGVVMAMDNILALFLLPIFGALSDKSSGKRGKRTPFILIGTVIAAVAFFGLSFADNMQLTNISDVSDVDSVSALEVLYDNEYKIYTDENGTTYQLKTPDGEKYTLAEKFTKEDFLSIKRTYKDAESGKEKNNPVYTDYVVPARQAYAWQRTVENPNVLLFFVGLLFVILISMSIFRSPAVALMPDVTIKPLRSKANAVINLMGAAGGIAVLLLGMVFGTGDSANALMNYIGFFAVIAAIMLISLVIFLATVKEKKWSEEMMEDSKKYGIDTENPHTDTAKISRKLTRGELFSLILILSSVVFWYMGYNAVTSKYSVYAGKVLNLDYNLSLTVATGVAILSYLPIGALSSKIGRKKTILAGILVLGAAFLLASFIREGTPLMVMNILFGMAGIGWSMINVNSYPMVVELSKGSDIGKYTGYYYTASMAAQTLTPVLSGKFLDIKFTTLFPYATIFVFASFVTMLFVKHGDVKTDFSANRLENFDVGD